MQIFNGRSFRDQILAELKVTIAKLPEKPIFCDVLVGSDPASAQYVRMKGKTAETIGIEFLQAQYPEDITTEALMIEINRLNQTPRMCGIIVQLPLPAHLDKQSVLNAIDPLLDVDATGEENTNLFYASTPRFVFPTAQAIMAIIDSVCPNISDKRVAILGKGELVGRPIYQLLHERGVDPEVVDRSTPDPHEITENAELIISAVGKGGFVTADMVQQGVLIIDAGTSESYGSIVGDILMDGMEDKASFISPTPGGVGPVTVAMLMRNVVMVATRVFHVS